MAHKRMFSKTIIEDDHFYDMPHSAQLLYFYLGMFADDDGFVSPRRIIKSNDFKNDDLKILISKEFVIPFENGVVVITHWKVNNTLRKDRHAETVYQKELSLLSTTGQGVYRLGNQMATVGMRSIEEDSIEESSIVKKSKRDLKVVNYASIYKSKNLRGYRFSIDQIDQVHEKVLSHMASTGKKYKDMTATVRNWLIRDKENGKLKQFIHPSQHEDHMEQQLENLAKKKVSDNT